MIQTMQRCNACRRHIAAYESRCPFCRAPAGLVGASAGSAIAALVASTIVLGCGDSGDVSTGDSTSASSSADTATDGMSNTSAPTVTDTSGATVTSGAEGTTAQVDTDMTSGGFIYGAPDLGDAVQCDVFAQDCPQDEKCQPWANDGGASWNATRCSPVAEQPNAVGEPCLVESSPVSGIDDCGVGALCWVVDAEALTGVCVAQCSGTEAAPVCEGDLACAVVAPGIAAVCVETCDPGAPACTGEGVCTTIDDSGYCLPDAAGDG